MNLYDIVKRKDRCLQIHEGDLEPVVRRGVGGYLGVRFSPGARVRLLRADEFNCLATFPRDPGWRLVATDPEAKPVFTISVVGIDGSDTPSGNRPDEIVYRWNGDDANRSGVLLAWPVWTGRCDGFDLELVNGSSLPVELASSAAFNPRAAIAHLIRGNGAEVGPGMNPFVKPTEGIEVTYVEALPMDE